MGKQITLTRETLYALVWSEPLLQLAKRYGLSDYGMRKLCIGLSVPMPRADYWSKVRTGHWPEKARLPAGYGGEQAVTLTLAIDLAGGSGWLVTADPLIVAVRNTLHNKEKSRFHRDLVCSEDGQPDIRVAPGNIDRACRFMDRFFRALRARGHTIEVRQRATYVIVRKQELQVICREKLSRIAVSEPTWFQQTQLCPAGILAFQLVCRFHQKEWTEGKESLEDKIPVILDKLEEESRRLSEEHEERERRRAVQEERDRLRKEQEKRREKERTDFGRLLRVAERWKQAAVLREYLAAVEGFDDATGLSPELREWLAWGRAKADWYDPLAGGSDEWLSERDKDELTVGKPSR